MRAASRHFLEDEMGIPCTFAFSRRAGVKPDNAEVREALRAKPPLVLFGSLQRTHVCGRSWAAAAMYIPASFPGAIIRRATGTPFMGYAGATYIVQEFCNALFDALFNILPLGTDLDRVEPTPARLDCELPVGRRRAGSCFDEYLETEPFLVRISAAKRLRDRVERDARQAGEDRVTSRVARRACARRDGGRHDRSAASEFRPAIVRRGWRAPWRRLRHGNPSRAGWARQRPRGRIRRVTVWLTERQRGPRSRG